MPTYKCPRDGETFSDKPSDGRCPIHDVPLKEIPDQPTDDKAETATAKPKTGRRRRGRRATTAAQLGQGLGLAMLLTLGASCGEVHGQIPPYPSTDQPRIGAEICDTFSKDLQAASSKWAVFGWLFGITGSLMAAMGGLAGTGPDGSSLRRKSAGVLLATLGSSLAATAAYSVSRSNAASAAASAAAKAQSEEKDWDRYVACATARSRWLDSRSESLDQTLPPQAKKADRSPGANPADSGNGKPAPVAKPAAAAKPATPAEKPASP